jgi:hypothetical protein
MRGGASLGFSSGIQNGYYPQTLDEEELLDMFRLSLAALTCALVMAAPGPAHAVGRSRAVIDLTGTPDEATVMKRLKDSFGAGFQAELVPIEALIDSSTGPWIASPPGQLQPCSGEPRSLSEIQAGLADAEALIDALDYDAAMPLLQELDEVLCACTEPLDPRAVRRIPYLRGIAEFYSADRDAARRSFSRAASLVDKLEWDTAFSPEPQQVFLLGVGDAMQEPGWTLVPGVGDAPVDLWVDGHPVASDGEGIPLGGDRHVLQFRDTDGQLRGKTLVTDGAGDVHLLGLEELTVGLGATPDDAQGAPSYAAVAAAAARLGYPEVAIIAETAWDRCWWFNEIDGVWKPVSLLAGGRLRAARNHRTAGGVLTGTGGAVVVAGTILALTQLAAMEDLRPEMETNASSYALNIDQYEQHRTSAAVGVGLLAAGGAVLNAGLLLMAKGKAIQDETDVDPRLTVFAAPGGAWVGLSGKF